MFFVIHSPSWYTSHKKIFFFPLFSLLLCLLLHIFLVSLSIFSDYITLVILFSSWDYILVISDCLVSIFVFLTLLFVVVLFWFSNFFPLPYTLKPSCVKVPLLTRPLPDNVCASHLHSFSLNLIRLSSLWLRYMLFITSLEPMGDRILSYLESFANTESLSK